MRAATAILASFLAACGVLATPGGGDENLPDARLGPFRPFAEGEVQLPPMAALDFTAQLGGPDVARAPDGAFVLTMHGAPDDDEVTVLRRMTGEAPTTFASPEVLLGGEPVGLRDPCVVEHDGTTLLFFGLGDGSQIGVARSEGGADFVRDDEPVLTSEDPVESPIGAPSVVIVDGDWLLYHSRADSIALAVSTDDGRTFEDEGIVLGPGEGWDDANAGEPAAVVTRSALGERRVRLYYTGTSSAEPYPRSVGVAVSFDGHTDFHRFVGNPIVSLDDDEWAPTVTLGEGDAPSFLYFGRASGSGRLGIAGAVLPGDVSLAAP
jgi:hypothetical protein